MGLFNTVLKSVAKKVALATLVVVGKQVLTKAIGNAIDKRKADESVADDAVQAPPHTTPAASDTAVKAKPVRKSRAKPKSVTSADDKPIKKPAASRSKPKDAGAATTTARKPRAPRKPKVVESKGEEPSTPNLPAQGSVNE